MPDTLGLVDASVEAHRLELGGDLRCARQVVDARKEEEGLRERMQLRAADWQDIDMAAGLMVI